MPPDFFVQAWRLRRRIAGARVGPLGEARPAPTRAKPLAQESRRLGARRGPGAPAKGSPEPELLYQLASDLPVGLTTQRASATVSPVYTEFI